ncbi:hypothetical protein ACHAW6_003119 [Cyclotella cf. meneghiniana]
MIDSKTKQPLFNKNAWKKANNILCDVLTGFYSDPPGLEFYTKRLGRNGQLMRSKYGLDLIECLRGTDCTEACHKNLAVTFGSWPIGVEMSDCLLAECRHHHNYRCSERHCFGFPVLGNYNTWVMDQLQNLLRENHDIQIKFKSTNETFDTIALHHESFHNKLEDKCKELGHVNLTWEQKSLAKSMGMSLPFLPFVNKDAQRAYVTFVLEG